MDSTDDEHGRTIDVGETLPWQVAYAEGDDLTADMAADADTYDEPVAEPLPVDALLDREGINTEIRAQRNRWESEVVGPGGETRAELRKLMLLGLAEFTSEVRRAQDACEIEPMDAFKLRIRLHRERCALVGLNVAQYTVPW